MEVSSFIGLLSYKSAKYLDIVDEGSYPSAGPLVFNMYTHERFSIRYRLTLPLELIVGSTEVSTPFINLLLGSLS